MSKTFFISFSGSISNSDLDLVSRQKILNHSALTIGNADQAIAYTRDDLLDSDFYHANRSILDNPRGAGFWAWKPYIILTTLKKLGANDWLIYSDSGKPFRKGDPKRAGNMCVGNIINTPFDDIISYAKKHNGFTPGVWIPHYGAAKVWSKRDCFVGMGCDTSEYHESGQVQAGYSCWSNSEQSIDFLQQWLRWVQVEAVVSDQPNIYGKPNFNEFRDHRHDQSILTNLVIKNNITLFGPRERSLDGHRDFNLILRHMALSNRLKSRAERFSGLFSGNKPELPAYTQPALNLWLLPELTQNSSVAVYHPHDQTRWQAALPECTVYFGEDILNNNKTVGKEKEPTLKGIFISHINDEPLLERMLVEGYEALAPGGLLYIGPFNGKKGAKPTINKGFNELLQWMFINQRFPSSLSKHENQQKSAITIGNALNPLISSLNSQQSQVILRKPHITISTLLTNTA